MFNTANATMQKCQYKHSMHIHVHSPISLTLTDTKSTGDYLMQCFHTDHKMYQEFIKIYSVMHSSKITCILKKQNLRLNIGHDFTTSST